LGLLLLLLWFSSPHAVCESDTSEWAAEWLARRNQQEEKQAERKKVDALLKYQF
jgi:hypothetical protein